MKGIFTTCLHPKVIKNPYTGAKMIVSCGKCEACLTSKGLRLSNFCQLESTGHRYCMFVTLTYDNEHLPVTRPYSVGKDLYDFVDESTGEIVYHQSISRHNLELLFRKSSAPYGLLPYLRKIDLQQFMKRLRYYVGKETEEKIRYFACGEYGPTTFRPHFHLLVWFSDEHLYHNFSRCVRDSWEFGFVRVELSRGDAANYTASYCNSNTTLPSVYLHDATKPFVCHSSYLGKSFFEKACEGIYELTAREFVQHDVVYAGKSRSVSVPRSYINLFYPKCSGFFCKSYEELSRSYNIYAVACKMYGTQISGKKLTCADYARLFVEDYTNAHRSGKWFDDTFWRWFRSEFGDLSILDVSDYYDCLYRKIYLSLRCSKRYLTYVVPHTPAYRDSLQMIIDFYKDLELMYMNDYLKQQEEYFSDDNINELDYLYPDLFRSADFLNTNFYKFSYLRSVELYHARVKHKLLNDANHIFETI